MKRNLNPCLLVSLIAGLGISASANATFGLGAGVGFGIEPYRNYDSSALPIPILYYDSDTFYYRGLTGGYHLYKDRINTLSFVAFYNPLQFKPEDAKDWSMKQLNKRKSSIMAGMKYQNQSRFGIVKLMMAADIIDNSNGVLADLSYGYRFNFGNASITPEIGSYWNSKKYNKYYFGIDGGEAQRSGLAHYSPGASWLPYVGLGYRHKVNNHITVALKGQVTKLSDEIKDSPMVSRSYQSSLFFGANYTF